MTTTHCTFSTVTWTTFVIHYYFFFVFNITVRNIMYSYQFSEAFRSFRTYVFKYLTELFVYLKNMSVSIHCTVCSYYVTYTFQSESTLYSCLNVKELLGRSRREIWSLSDCNGTRTHNHLVLKRTVNNLAKLAKWLSCIVSTYLCDRVWVHSETCMWYDRNIQSNAPYR